MVSWPLKCFTSPWKNSMEIRNVSDCADGNKCYTKAQAKVIMISILLIKRSCSILSYQDDVFIYINIWWNSNRTKCKGKWLSEKMIKQWYWKKCPYWLYYVLFLFGTCELFIVFLLPNDNIVLSCLTTYSIYDTGWRITMSNSFPNQHLK